MQRLASGRVWAAAGTYLALVLACAFALLPILWAIGTSLKSPADVLRYPPRWVPYPVDWSNYRLVVGGSNLPRYFFNSTVTAAATIVSTLVVAAHGGYAAARYEFPGKDALLFVILMTAMVPGIAILVPLYTIAARLGALDTYWVLVLVFTASQTPTVLWFLRGFYAHLPRELEEAALVDGCTRWGAFYRVVWPITRPGLMAAAMVVLVYVWNEFIISITLTASDDMRLLPVGLYYYISAFGIEWGKLMAAVTIAIAPIVVLFAFCQRHFVRGLTAGATKG